MCGDSVVHVARCVMRAGCRHFAVLSLLLVGCQANSHHDAGNAPSRATTAKVSSDVMDSAEAAARRIVAGGKLYVTGERPDFAAEAIGRAGGLMMIAAPNAVSANDVVLLAFDRSGTNALREQSMAWKRNGAYIIAFAPEAMDCADKTVFTDSVNGAMSESASSLKNLANLWVWTAEFTAACVRAGKMPVFYESFGMPGGHARADKYAGQRFHSDLTVSPIGKSLLATQYLEQLQHTKTLLMQRNRDQFEKARHYLEGVAADRVCVLAEGHIWSGRFEMEPAHVPPNAQVVVHLSYQEPPQSLIERARKGEFKLIYCSVRRGENDVSDAIVYIDPCWSRPDGCVRLVGYDIPIFPQSGIVQSWIYSELRLMSDASVK
jgi:hypothetical protein